MASEDPALEQAWGEETDESWEAFCQRCGEGRFTDWLREQAGEVMKVVEEHPFAYQFAAGTLDQATKRWYMIQHHRLFDGIVVLLAASIAHMRCLEDRIPCCQFLTSLTCSMSAYLDRVFRALGVSASDRLAEPDVEVVQAFQARMRSVAFSGDLAQMLAMLLALEWCYLRWGERVLPVEDSADSFWSAEWVTLHSGEAVRAFVEHLRLLLDKEAPRIFEELEGLQLCTEAFTKSAQFQLDFCNMAMPMA